MSDWYGVPSGTYDEMYARMLLLKDVKILREALEFYADERNYFIPKNFDQNPTNIESDGGERARIALDKFR